MKATIKNCLCIMALLSAFPSFSRERMTRIASEYVYRIRDDGSRKKDLVLVKTTNQLYTGETKAFDILYDSSFAKINGNTAILANLFDPETPARYQYTYGKNIVTIKKYYRGADSLLQVSQFIFGVNNRLRMECHVKVNTSAKIEKQYFYDRNGRLAKTVHYRNGKITGYIKYEYVTVNSGSNS